MTKDPLRIPDFLNHILEAIRRIDHYTTNIDEIEFLNNELIQDAVIRNIEILGEAARNIDRNHSDFSETHSEIPWRDIYQMRNQVSHGYFAVDLEIIWNTLQRDLPELKQQIERLVSTASKND